MQPSTALFIALLLSLLSSAATLRVPMKVSVAVIATEAFVPTSNTFVARKIFVTSPVADDAFSVAVQKKVSATYDISLKDQMRDAFEVRSTTNRTIKRI
eukprot:6346101-Prymnesium_polylepis.1